VDLSKSQKWAGIGGNYIYFKYSDKKGLFIDLKKYFKVTPIAFVNDEVYTKQNSGIF